VVFITVVIEAHEEHAVAYFDIPGAFLHTNLDKDIIMILKGRLAELMVKMAPNLYRKYISVDRMGTTILYIRCRKQFMGFSGVPCCFIISLWLTWRLMGL
jgi:hypothetical protein